MINGVFVSATNLYYYYYYCYVMYNVNYIFYGDGYEIGYYSRTFSYNGNMHLINITLFNLWLNLYRIKINLSPTLVEIRKFSSNISIKQF